MPRIPLGRYPEPHLHKPSGQARVRLDGRDYWLGKFGSAAARRRFDQLLATWLANGRKMPDPSAAPEAPPVPPAAHRGLTISELIDRYRKHVEIYYRKGGKPTGEVDNIRHALKPLRKTYGREPAASFGPLALQAVREQMIQLGWARAHINRQVLRIKRLFKWGAAIELVPPAVYQGLQAVEGLRSGRCSARETKPVRPVTDQVVEATLPHMPPMLADVVRLLRLTGARCGEILQARPCDFDTSRDVWEFRPASHKTEHHGRERVIYLGPIAQGVLRPHLEAVEDPEVFLFTPARSEAERNARRRAARKTPLWPGHVERYRRQAKGKAFRPHYDARSLRWAITRACELAKIEPWHPHQLRHSRATEVRARLSLEHAAAALGHANIGITQVYAELDAERGREVARKTG